MTTQTETSTITQRLMAVLEEGTDGAVKPDPSDTGTDSIRRLAVSSVAMLEFLVTVEDEFGIEWDDDVDESVLHSFDAIAAHIISERAQ